MWNKDKDSKNSDYKNDLGVLKFDKTTDETKFRNSLVISSGKWVIREPDHIRSNFL